MSILSNNMTQSFIGMVAILFMTISSTATIAQTKVFAKVASNDSYAYSGSNENYVFYTVSASNTDGGFRYMGIVREDKKTKERAVLYNGKFIWDFMVCGDWVYYSNSATQRGYINRVKVDGSKHELIRVNSQPFIYKERLYFTDDNALKFYDLNTMNITTASSKISSLNTICNDMGIVFDNVKATYSIVQLDSVSGIVTSINTCKLNGLDQYYYSDIILNDGYLYYSGSREADEALYLSTQGALYRSKLGDNDAQAELVASAPTTKTGASIDMHYTLGSIMDDDCIYINYRGFESPNNGEIWRYSLDGKVKKRVTILLTDAMSKCEDWIYTMGQWTWEQRRTNVKTGKQELLFKGKADDLSALNELKNLIPTKAVIHPSSLTEKPKPDAVIHPKSITEKPKSDAVLYPNNPYVIVDKLHKYKQQGYMLSKDKNSKKYYRVADVAEMLSKTKKAFNYKISGNTMTFTTGKYAPKEKVKERPSDVSLPAMRHTGHIVLRNTKKPVTYYEADGEQFYMFRDILGILNVHVEGSNVITTTPK